MSFVSFVHCIDTEGPLYESLQAKFDRIKEVFGIKIKPTSKNLIKLREKKIPLKGKEEEVANLLSSHLTNYNDTWKKIDKMHSIFKKYIARCMFDRNEFFSIMLRDRYIDRILNVTNPVFRSDIFKISPKYICAIRFE